MKKKKIISIKTPQLIKLRNNLRSILLNYCYKELSRLHEMWMAELNEKIQGSLMEQIIELERIKNFSICECATCHRNNQDMTYNPVLKRWFCGECYSMNQKFYRKSEEPYAEYLFP